MSFFRRLTAATLGYVAASLAMSIMYILTEDLLFFWRSGMVFFDLWDRAMVLIFGAWVAAIYGVLPAAPLIVLSEVTRQRGWTRFIAGGALVGAFMFAEMHIYPLIQNPLGLETLVALVIAGSLCGIVYRSAANRLLPISE